MEETAQTSKPNIKTGSQTAKCVLQSLTIIINFKIIFWSLAFASNETTQRENLRRIAK